MSASSSHRSAVCLAWIGCGFLATALIAPSATAEGGISVAWNECQPDGGAAVRYFACNDNGGAETIVASYLTEVPIPDFQALSARIELEVSRAELPDWWQLFNPGVCREHALLASAGTSVNPESNCSNPWSESVTGGMSEYVVPASLDPATASIVVRYAQPTTTALESGTEYRGFQLTLTHERTMGPGACSGCSDATCLWLTAVDLKGADGTVVHLTTTLVNATLNWQHQTPCMNYPDAALPRTWGQVKQLYR